MPGLCAEGRWTVLELTGIYPTHLRASFQSHCMFRRGISTMFVSLWRSIFLWVKTPTLSNCLKAENVELVRSTLRTSGKSQVLITKTVIGQCVGHLELLIRGGLGQSGEVVEQGSKGGVKEQRNSRSTGTEEQRNSRGRETATLRTASPSIVLERGGRGGRSDSETSAVRRLC